MTPQAVLTELLDRVAALEGEAVLLHADELAEWPAETVVALKAQKLITRARPATSAICPGCERECVMPVHVLRNASQTAEAFIVCDKRSDINRVPLPVPRLEQWQASGDSIADLLARLLRMHRTGADATADGRWEVGLFKGSKRTSHLMLLAGDRLSLRLAGQTIPLSEVLTLEGNAVTVDGCALSRRVDQPAAGAGDTESATQRTAARASQKARPDPDDQGHQGLPQNLRRRGINAGHYAMALSSAHAAQRRISTSTPLLTADSAISNTFSVIASER